jgi:hypothetical protein
MSVPAEKAPAGAGEDHHADIVVGIGPVERVEHLVDHRIAEGVELIGPRQRDRRDAVLHAVIDGRVGHSDCPSSMVITDPVVCALASLHRNSSIASSEPMSITRSRAKVPFSRRPASLSK